MSQVDDGIVFNQICILQGRLYPQFAILYKDILIRDSGLLKLAIAAATRLVSSNHLQEISNLPETTDLNLLRPDLFIQSSTRKVLHVHWAVLIILNRAVALPAEESSKADAKTDTNQGKDSVPFLSGVFLVKPWSFVRFIRIDATGPKVCLMSA